MQFQVRVRIGAGLLGLLMLLVLGATSFDPALAKTQTKKHPKGFVHDTAGDGKPDAPQATTVGIKRALPKWEQYDAGGLYYYNLNQTEKARQYWMEALKLAEAEVPAERAKGLSPATADACCKLVKHLLYFVNNVKFRPDYDSSYVGGALGKTAVSQGGNPLQYRLDSIKESLRQMYKDWDWYERVGNFADRAIGKQRDCLRQVYSGREIFEHKIIMTRQTGQQLERSMGIEFKNSSIDTRPMKWGGVEGAGNPFATAGSNPIPLKYRGGAPSGVFDPQ